MIIEIIIGFIISYLFIASIIYISYRQLGYGELSSFKKSIIWPVYWLFN